MQKSAECNARRRPCWKTTQKRRTSESVSRQSDSQTSRPSPAGKPSSPGVKIGRCFFLLSHYNLSHDQDMSCNFSVDRRGDRQDRLSLGFQTPHPSKQRLPHEPSVGVSWRVFSAVSKTAKSPFQVFRQRADNVALRKKA